MSNDNQTRSAVNAAPGDGTTAPPAIPSPTLTRYQQVAGNLSKAIDEAAQLIPDFQIAHPSKKNFIRVHAGVPIPFLATTVVAVDDRPELSVLNKLDANEGRDTIQFLEAFRSAQDKVDAFSNNLKFTMGLKKANFAERALQVYVIAKGLARDPNGAAVAAHVANMKRDLGRTRPKVTAPKAPSPQPKPGSVTTAEEAKAA